MKVKTLTVVLKTRGLSATSLAVYGQTIVTALSGNPNFPDLFPSVAMLDDAVKALNLALVNNRPGDKLSTANLHLAVSVLKRTLKAIAAHVEFVSNNDQNMVLSSGMQLKELSQRTAQGFVVEYGEHSGTVELKHPAVKKASYIWQYAPDPVKDEKNWIVASTTMKTLCRIEGLVPGQRYWFRVSVVDMSGQHPPCDPLMVMVL